jgi:hypothetical protein
MGADIQDAGGGVPRHHIAGEDERDRIVGHLVALATILPRPVGSTQEGGFLEYSDESGAQIVPVEPLSAPITGYHLRSLLTAGQNANPRARTA